MKVSTIAKPTWEMLLRWPWAVSASIAKSFLCQVLHLPEHPEEIKKTLLPKPFFCIFQNGNGSSGAATRAANFLHRN